MRQDGPLGVAAADLTDEALLRELASVHRTRNDALRHRPGAALGHHDRRSHELEAEYLRRFPRREVDAAGSRRGGAQAPPPDPTPQLAGHDRRNLTGGPRDGNRRA